ncbi:porin family protein [Mesonia aquimarina]|uniref:TonB-dependent receptor n=1 Tax=Mesonia aquimarina TaxID=1504967 RepID=UPI000EF613B9|nr:TonB-dependent receptor [Mesonia aquimarina]
MQFLSFYKTLFLVAICLSTSFVFAQKDDKEEAEIDTERLIIVKPYSPSVSDAFKVKQTPSINDSTERKKKKVTYDIFSFPVASTFTPAKGKAAGVQQKSRPYLYDNYASLGVGNYLNILAEFYGTLQLNQNQELGIAFNHNSSQGGIDNAVLDDKFYNTDLDLSYESQARGYTWGTDLGVEHLVYNWYGAPNYLPITNADYDGIDPQHSYYAISVGANIDVEQGIFDKADFNYRRFGDNFGSGENHVLLTPKFQFPIGNENVVNADFSVDYVNGNFDQALYNDSSLKYSYLNLGILPSIQVSEGDFAFDIGAQLVYSMNAENDENTIYVYPKVTGSYRIAGDYFIAYTGVEGGLQQNTYYDFVQDNPFVSPTLGIAPTDKQYNVYVGGKGKFTENISYDVRANYSAEKDKALFIHNPYQSSLASEGFEYFNSFSTVYDDVKTLGAFGELQVAFNDKLQLKANVELQTYDVENQEEAWNLPQLSGSFLADYQITEKWSAGATIYYMGERKDYFSYTASSLTEDKTVTLDGFVDVNLNVGYQLNNRLGFFLRGNNLLEGNYQRWMGYSVQDIQVMAGATYQFDW